MFRCEASSNFSAPMVNYRTMVRRPGLSDSPIRRPSARVPRAARSSSRTSRSLFTTMRAKRGTIDRGQNQIERPANKPSCLALFGAHGVRTLRERPRAIVFACVRSPARASERECVPTVRTARCASSSRRSRRTTQRGGQIASTPSESAEIASQRFAPYFFEGAGVGVATGTAPAGVGVATGAAPAGVTARPCSR